MKNRAYYVCNRAMVPEEGGWYHITPFGEFPGFLGGAEPKPITQVCDAEAMALMMSAWQRQRQSPDWPGYLVSREHFAHQPDQSSEAAAWAPELKVVLDGDPARAGLWARYEKTDLGEQIIGTRYKYATVVANVEHIDTDRYRLVELVDIGLTNKPQLKTLVPAQNRDRHIEEDSDMLDKLRTLLGLAGNAGEDAVLAQIGTVVNRATEAATLQTQLAAVTVERDELSTAALNREADAFVEAHGDAFTEPDKARVFFVANRAAAEEMVGLLKTPQETTKRVLNRGDGSTPKDAGAADEAALVANRQREQRQALNRVKLERGITSNMIAWPIARSENPELFNNETPAAE